LGKAYDAIVPINQKLSDQEVEALHKAEPITSKQDYKYYLPSAILNPDYMPDLKLLERIASKLIEQGNGIHPYR
jgi:hypothetical protein